MELMASACPLRAESFPGKGPLSADGSNGDRDGAQLSGV